MPVGVRAGMLTVTVAVLDAPAARTGIARVPPSRTSAPSFTVSSER